MSLSQKLRTVKIEVEKSAGCYKAHTHTHVHMHTHTHGCPKLRNTGYCFFGFIVLAAGCRFTMNSVATRNVHTQTGVRILCRREPKALCDNLSPWR